MLLIDTLLIGIIATAVYREKISNAEQVELIPIPVREEESKAQKTNE